MSWKKYLAIRKDKRFRKPCIKETWITVYDEFNWLSKAMDPEGIQSDFEEVTDEMIDACTAFAADKARKLIAVTWTNLLWVPIFSLIFRIKIDV